MRRRKFLAAAGTGTITGLSGCFGLFETRSALAPPLVEDRPSAAYYPTHVEGMAMVGTAENAGYTAALTYTYPHRFWLVTGTRTQRVRIKPSDSVHLMPVVWDTETGIVPPDINPGLTVEQDGESVANPAPWAMLSQPMGFHFGENVALDGDGTYTVTVDVGSPSIRRTGGLSDDRGGTSFEFEFEYSESAKQAIAYTDIPSDREGTRGAVDPMAMEMMPSTTAPPESALPGTVIGAGTSGDAVVVATLIDDATPYGGGSDESYLAISPRTPYNRFVLPMATVAATVERGSATVSDPTVTAAIDPDLRYHYGAPVSGVEPGDSVTITFQTPPQMARHEGYETAFVEMDPVSLTVPPDGGYP